MPKMGAAGLVVMLIVAIAAGCASGRGAAGPQVGAEGIVTDVTVENGTGVDLRITALHGNSQTQIGTVRAMGSRTLRLPPGAQDLVRLVAEPLGGSMASRLFSEPIRLAEGRRATWQIRATGSSTVVYGVGGIRP
jgi:hypothetical protein